MGRSSVRGRVETTQTASRTGGMNMGDKGEMGMTLRFLQGTNIVLILQKAAGYPTGVQSSTEAFDICYKYRFWGERRLASAKI